MSICFLFVLIFLGCQLWVIGDFPELDLKVLGRKEGNRFAVEYQYTAVDKPRDAIDKPFTLKDK